MVHQIGLKDAKSQKFHILAFKGEGAGMIQILRSKATAQAPAPAHERGQFVLSHKSCFLVFIHKKSLKIVIFLFLNDGKP
jgi:hypothetical protein